MTGSDLPADGDFAALANQVRGGFARLIGLRFTRVTTEEVCAEVPVTDALLQPYGLVHGGVYASIVETLCSTGAGVHALLQGRSCVGLENSTSFLRGVRDGTLRARAVPLHQGGRSEVWRCEVADAGGVRVAEGRVRLLILDEDSRVGGGALRLPGTGGEEG